MAVRRARWISNVACLLLLLVCGVAVSSGRLGLVRVGGGSMEPALYPGDVCLVTRSGRPGVSDIVLLTEPGHASRVLHRVQTVNGGILTTRGDANPVPDREPLPTSAVLGKVTRVLPVGRLIHRWQAASGR